MTPFSFLIGAAFAGGSLNYQAVKLVPIRNTWASDFSYILYGNFSHTFCMGISSTLGAQKGHFSTPLIEPKPNYGSIFRADASDYKFESLQLSTTDIFC